MAWIKEQRGKRFDPDLVDILVDNLSAFAAISNRYGSSTSEEPDAFRAGVQENKRQR